MRRFGFNIAASMQATLFCHGRRWNTSTSFNASKAENTNSTSSSTSSSSNSDIPPVMERASQARGEIHELWLTNTTISDSDERTQRVANLIQKYKLDPTTPREEDVSRGLGDAFDRLLLLCVPLSKNNNNNNNNSTTDDLERLLHLAGRNGRELSVRTIQHLFARTDSFTEALAIFYTLRRCHVAMNMEAYYAMLYSLQRLEEEGWAQRFHEEFTSEEKLSEQAMEFVLRGVDRALLPENKPWLGRVMFGDRDTPAMRHEGREYDVMSTAWRQRYGEGAVLPSE